MGFERFNPLRLFNRWRTSERRDPDTGMGWRGRTQAGVVVTPDNALVVSTVWACCRYLSQTVGQLPWRVMRNDGDYRRLSASHPVDYLLYVRPNPEWSPFQFKETMIHWAARYGNAYAEIERNAVGMPIALWPIEPERVEVRRDDVTRDLYYEINNGTDGRIDLPAMDVFHLRGFGNNPVGLNVMHYAAESIGWARAVQIFGAAFFGNGMNIAGAAVTKKPLEPAGRARLEKELNSRFVGPYRANKWFVGDSEMELKTLMIEPNKGQFIETGQHLVEEICRWFGVPPHKVMHLMRAHFNNVEQLGIEVVVDAITPWVTRMEEEADYKLFGQNRRGFYTHMEMKALQRGDFKSQQEGLEVMRRNGIINGDDWRRELDMDPLPAGSGGNRYILQSQWTPLDAVDQAVPEDPDPSDDGDQAALPPPVDPSAPDNAGEIPDDLAAMIARMREAA